MLTISGLSVRYRLDGGFVQVVQDASLSVAKGEVVGIIGESGAGKTTVGNAVAGMISPPGIISSGNVDLLGNDMTVLAERDRSVLRGKLVTCIFQNPLAALDPLERIGRQIVETIVLNNAGSRATARKKTLELLARVGIEEPAAVARMYPHQLSGGMLQRVVIAIAISCDPCLVIADEPTTALDVTLQKGIMELLAGIVSERGMGVLLITHNIAVVSLAAQRIYVMRNGRIVEHGSTPEVIRSPKNEYTRELIAATPPTVGKLRRFRQPAQMPPSRISELVQRWHAGGGCRENLGRRDPLIGFEGVSVVFREPGSARSIGRKVAVENFSLKIARGEIFGLVGGSGSGKTTVARALAGLLPVTAGKIIYKDRLLAAAGRPYNRNAARPEIQMIFQNPHASLNPRMRVSQQIAEVLRVRGVVGRRDVSAAAAELVEAVGLPASVLGKYPHEFSGGERQRLSIVRALSAYPSVLICDEPTSALDVSVQASVLNLLKDVNEHLGVTLIFITHDLPVCRHMCGRVGILSGGKLCEVGEVVDVLDSPAHPATRALVDAIPKIEGPAPQNR